MCFLKIILLSILFNFVISEITQETKDKLLIDFINYYNLQPNQPYKASEGYLRSIEQSDPSTYKVDISFKVQNNGPKLMQCTATIQDIGDMGIAIVNYDMHCGELLKQASEDPDEAKETSIEAEAQDAGPVKLENEVQADTGTTSGEQFIAIPRPQPAAPCIGCASYVNPQAEGVSDLANMGIRHLDLHDPSMKHTLDSVISVERQVQVVNGVRYVLTLLINFNNCSESITDACVFIETCKISILVKPWQILPSGSKYRAILSNNCTEIWQFGDNGEVLPENSNIGDQNNKPGQSNDNISTDRDHINFEHIEGVYSEPNKERRLSIDEIGAIEEQIIPVDQAQGYFYKNRKSSNNKSDEETNHVLKSETSQNYNDNFVAIASDKHETNNLSLDKKKLIDEMLDFFNFSGVKPKIESNGIISREKRSYDHDLKVLSYTENYKALRSSLENAKYVFKVAQKMIDYLNEYDMVIKNRVLNNVIKAEEEEDNEKRFLYIQMQVLIPCDAANFEDTDSETKICNGVFDISDRNEPQILKSFCYSDSKNKEKLNAFKEVPLSDPVLLRLTKKILMKIESESVKSNALKFKEILSAKTRLGSGRITKISLVLEHLNCNKSVPIVLRSNCSQIEYLSSSICEVIVHERDWLKEMKITYSCTEPNPDATITKMKTKYPKITEDDPNITKILEESLQYLELKSNRQNKQKIVTIKNISTNIIAGFLIKIEFIVGYTNCTIAESSNCSLLKNETLRMCKAHIWERPWMVDGRQLEVYCDEDGDVRHEIEISRNKRSARFISKSNKKTRHILLGGQSTQDPNDPDVIKLANESMHKYLASNGNSQPHRIVRINKATLQVVSGFLTRIDFIITTMNKDKDDVLNCYSEIWERQWLNEKEITVTCDVLKQRIKRSDLVGAPIEKDPSDPRYSNLAEESMRKYLTSSGNSESFKVARIVRVIVHMVAGTLTEIDFVVTPTGNTNSNNFNCHSKVWERSWLNKKEITVTCDVLKQRIKRSDLVGAPIEKDPSDPRYSKLAEESMRKYLTSSGNSESFKVARIERVIVQLLAGTLTEIDFVVTPIGNTNSNNLNCHSKVWERSWLNEKEITVTCDVLKQRIKRSDLVGAPIEKDPSDPRYSKLAEESMRKYLTSSGNSESFKVARIVKVIVQLVAGTLTEIDFVVTPTGNTNSNNLNCHSKVWERPWLNEKEITVTCDVLKQRIKRSDLVGAPIEKDPSDPRYSKLAEESMRKYLTSSGNSESFKVARIVRVIVQLVAGTLTEIDFVVTPTGNTNSNNLNCHSKVWERSWLNEKEITVTCDVLKQRIKRSDLVGAPIEKDPSDPRYSKLAEESMRKYLTSNGNSESFKVARIVRVIVQLVAGTLTEIDFVVTPTRNTNSNNLNCHSKVWERSWLNEKEITVTCDVLKQRIKRSDLVGAPIEKDPSDPRYSKLAEESMRKYLTSSGNSESFKVARIVRVVVQLVSGTLTEIDFVVTPTGNTNSNNLDCHSKVWERPWLNEKEINVTCIIIRRAGDKTEQDPTDPKYIKLADDSLKKYLKSNDNCKPHKVVRINKVSNEVVARTVTKLDFVATETENSTDHILNCHSDVQGEQALLDKNSIEVYCQVLKHRRTAGSIGEVIEQNSNDPRYLQLAEESLHKYLSATGIRELYMVIRVDKVSTQMVYGILTRVNFISMPVDTSNSAVMTCFSDIWEEPLVNNTDLQVACHPYVEKVKTQITGIPSEENPSDKKFMLLAKESLQKYISNTGTKQLLEVIRVEKAGTQFATGLITKIEFLVMIYGTRNATMICISEILEQVWLMQKKINIVCEKEALKLRKLQFSLSDNNNYQYLHHNGNIEQDRDIKKPEFHILASLALQKFSKERGTFHKVLKLLEVTSRIVSGTIYKIYFIASPTDCNSSVSFEHAHNCKVISNVTLICQSEIWDQPPIRHKSITVRCNNDDTDFDDFPEMEEASEAILNEISPFAKGQSQTLEESKIDALAEEALEYYLTYTNTEYIFRITQIHNSYEHLDDGIINKIEFSIAPTICLQREFSGSLNNCDFMIPKMEKYCTAHILKQPWLGKKKKIVVTCEKSQNDADPEKETRRTKRQLDMEQIDKEDNEVDEDATYYYADRAIQHLNDATDTNNLYKLITVHAMKTSMQMKTMVVKMYIEIAETYCLRHQRDVNLDSCDEMEGLNHRLCFVRIYPSPDDEMAIRHVAVVCDDNDNEFEVVTGLNIAELVRLSIEALEYKPENRFKLVHQGEPLVIPSLETNKPLKLNFIVATTNCTRDVKLDKNPFQCYLDATIPAKSCISFIWLDTQTKTIHNIDVSCQPDNPRLKRSLRDTVSITKNSIDIEQFVTSALEQLEMSSLHRYKLRVLHINSYSTKITSGISTTVDFDIGYTACLKYEWVENITSCNILEHLPRRHCVAHILERLWVHNGKNIEVSCEDDETPLEAHIEFENADMAMQLAQDSLKHIEAKYPHPRKHKVVRLFSLEKQVVAGIHYRMKMEVGVTTCAALSVDRNCKLDKDVMNKFCQVHIWVRTWTDNPPNFRIYCDFQEGNAADLYHHIQAENLFFNFLAIYNPSYVNDHAEVEKRFWIFKKNIKKIHEYNVHEKGTATYGVTRFTDLTYQEFSSLYMGLKTNLRVKNLPVMKTVDIPNNELPLNFDWRNVDAVTEVKDQLSCGSSWAFSVIGNIESQWKIHSGNLVLFSEQVLLDCDKYNAGCDGGLPENAYRTIEELGGLQLDTDYPYEGEVDQCLFNKTMAMARITGVVNITSNESGMAQWLFKNGPISVGINGRAMQFYQGGISHPGKSFCNSTELDHSVLIVGFGVKEYAQYHKKLPYWIVKNSWGSIWGEQGYYRVYRGDGTCGINKMASSAVIET